MYKYLPTVSLILNVEEDFYYAFATTAEGGLGCTDPAADNYDANCDSR